MKSEVSNELKQEDNIPGEEVILIKMLQIPPLQGEPATLSISTFFTRLQ